jgi:xanthine/CO dehydrogenase XdhC/CoxF family maturation factor
MTPHAFIMARITDAQGSTPREAGAYMLIAADATLGSIGGGRLEQQVMAEARGLLRDGAFHTYRERVFTLGTAMGQCCGGRVSIGYKYCTAAAQWQHPNAVSANTFPIVLFGAGHVGKALAAILATQPCRLHWLDSREA